MNEVSLFILHTSLIKDNLSFVLSKVDKSRAQKANKYKNEKDQLLSLAGAFLFYKYLPHQEMKYSDKGKPFFENGPYFNLSHSGEYSVLAISQNREVGVDIERINVDKIETIRFVLNEEEKEVNDTNTLFKIWSNKESFIKCLGSDIGDIKKVKGLPLEGVRDCSYTKSDIFDNYSLSVTLKGKDSFLLKIIKVNSLEE